MITIYHNSRCSKSRAAVELLTAKGKTFTIREYMKEPMTEEELEDVIGKLNMDAIDLVRKKEVDWKTHFATKDLDENEVILAMIEYPKLMERPIVVNGEKAAIGRPTEAIEEILT